MKLRAGPIVRALPPYVCAFAVALCALLTATAAHAQDGLLGGLRTRWTADSPAKAWEEARRSVDAAAAAPIMRELTLQEKDPVVAARAALWLGHYAYGSGRMREALTHFERAEASTESASIRGRGAFWSAQCRNLLEIGDVDPVALPVTAAMNRQSDVLAALAVGDALIRGGDPQGALRKYLSVEDAARDLGCLAPLCYRVALVVSATESAGLASGGVGWDTVRQWEPAISQAPERGLIAALRFGDRSSPKTPAADASTRFSEPETEPPPPAPDDVDPARPDHEEDVVEPAEPPRGARVYVLQLGAYRDRRGARREMERWTARGLSVRLEPGRDAEGDEIYRIRLGREETRDAARALADRLLPDVDYEIVEVRP